MSNDLYPPNLDFFNGKKSALNALNKETYLLYEKIFNNKHIEPSQIDELPNGSHKLFLKGILCLKDNPTSDFNLLKKCTNLLVSARDNDILPYRVLEEINNYIRSLYVNKKVFIIDPAKTLEWDKMSDYFVDFQHPSTLGHIVIANLIIEILDGKTSKKKIKGINYNCKNEIFIKTSQNDGVIIDTYPRFVKNAAIINKNWLERFIATSSAPYMHQYYLKKAKSLLNGCK